MSSQFPFLANQELDMTGHAIINVLDPVSAQDAATKNYVDTHSATNVLPTNEIFVGNGSNLAAAVAMSGDATIVSSGALTLASTGVSAGSYGSASSVAALTVDAKGRLTAASSTSIQIAESQVTNLVSDLAAKLSNSLTSAHIFVGNGSNVATNVAASGDLSLSNTGAFSITATSNSTLVTLSALSLPAAQISGVLSEVQGGTNQSSYATGDILYASATNTLSKLPASADGDVLTLASGVPSWAPAAASGANIELSNLDPAGTAISQPLTFDPAVPGALLTPDTTGVNSNPLSIYTGVANGTGVVGGSISIYTQDIPGPGAGNTSGDIDISTGTAFSASGNINLTTGGSAGTGGSIHLSVVAPGSAILLTDNNSGSINLANGVATIVGNGAGTSIQFQDGSQGTAGYVWTSQDANGSGKWIAPSPGSSAAGPSGAVQFSDGSGVFLADDASFHWDDTAKSLSIGIAPNTSAAILSIDGDDGSGNGQIYLSNQAGSSQFAIMGVEGSPPAILGGNPGDFSLFAGGGPAAIQMECGGGIFLAGTSTGGAVLSIPNTNNHIQVSPVSPTHSTDYAMLSVGDGGFAGGGAPNFTGISSNGTYIGLNASGASPTLTPTLMDLQIAGVSVYSIGGLPGSNAPFARVSTSASHVDALRVNTTAADDTLSAGSDYAVVYNIASGSFNINLPPGEQGLTFRLAKAFNNSAVLTIVPDSGNPDVLDANIQAIFTSEPVTIMYNAADFTWYPV